MRAGLFSAAIVLATLAAPAAAEPDDPYGLNAMPADPPKPIGGESVPNRQFSALNDKDGIQKWKFGSEPRAYGLRLVRDADGESRASVGLTSIGAVKVSVSLSFGDGGLTSIAMMPVNVSENGLFFASLVSAYGNPVQPNQFIEDFIWATPNMRLAYVTSPVSGKATAIFTSERHRAIERSNSARRAQQAAPDLE